MHHQQNPKNHPVPDTPGTCAGFCAGFFDKKPNEIKHVPDVPDFSPTPFMRVRVCARASTRAFFRLSHGYIPRHIRHIRHILVFIDKNGKKGGTVSGTNLLNPAQPGQPPVLTTRTIKTSPANAKEVQQLVKQDPELLALVQSLQAQNLFPGLRSLTFTLTGTPEHCAKGLQAWAEAMPAPKEAPPC